MDSLKRNPILRKIFSPVTTIILVSVVLTKMILEWKAISAFGHQIPFFVIVVPLICLLAYLVRKTINQGDKEKYPIVIDDSWGTQIKDNDFLKYLENHTKDRNPNNVET